MSNKSKGVLAILLPILVLIALFFHLLNMPAMPQSWFESTNTTTADDTNLVKSDNEKRPDYWIQFNVSPLPPSIMLTYVSSWDEWIEYLDFDNSPDRSEYEAYVSYILLLFEQRSAEGVHFKIRHEDIPSLSGFRSSIDKIIKLYNNSHETNLEWKIVSLADGSMRILIRR